MVKHNRTHDLICEITGSGFKVARSTFRRMGQELSGPDEAFSYQH